jgi:mRNA-degrading endonuclease toxin of MazEF toxin-antitoxin module
VYIKHFDEWNIQKKIIDEQPRIRFCHSREIWWCSLGVNIGSEQDGKNEDFGRPIVVIQTFNPHTFLGVAVTSKVKENKDYFPIGIVKGKPSSVVLSQIRTIDTKRIIRKMGMMDQVLFENLKEALQIKIFGNKKQFSPA